MTDEKGKTMGIAEGVGGRGNGFEKREREETGAKCTYDEEKKTTSRN